MGDNVREYVEAREKQREAGLELDALLETRRGMAEMSRKMTVNFVTDEQRDQILDAYNRKVAEIDLQAAKLRHQIEVLDAELDVLAEVHGPQRTWRNA